MLKTLGQVSNGQESEAGVSMFCCKTSFVASLQIKILNLANGSAADAASVNLPTDTDYNVSASSPVATFNLIRFY